MIAVLSLFVVVLLSLLLTRIATVALTLTGLSRESARFQARSAFTGTGFTTSEAEAMLNHPLRRRIVMMLMLLGSAGIVSVLATMILSFGTVDGSTEALRRLGMAAGGLLVLWRLAASRAADRWLSRVIERGLRRYTDLEVRDYASLLRLSGDWVVAELRVEPDDWLADRPLQDLALPKEGVLVLGVERADGRWVGAPKGHAELHAGDVAVVYGQRDTLAALDQRRRDWTGDWQHHSQREAFEQELERQDAEEAAAEEADPADS